MGNKRKPAQGQAGSSSKKKKFSKGPKAKPHPPKQQDVPLPDSDDASENSDVGDEDLEFVQQYGSRLSFLKDLDAQQLNKAVQAKQKAAADAAVTKAAGARSGGDGDSDADELGSEEDAAEYERRPRAAEQVTKASAYGLPVKAPTGEIVFQPSHTRQLTAAKVQVEGVTVTDTLQTEQQQQHKAAKAAANEAAAAAAAEKRAAAAAAAAAAAKAAEVAAAAAKETGAQLPAALLSLMAIQDQQQRRDALKQQMALAAQHLLAEPEKHVGPGLRLLLGCALDKDGQVARLALLSLLAVFKDILPGYRIRSLSEEEQEMRVSKEVQALREFEQALLKGYQSYLKTLLAATTAKPSSEGHSASSILASKRVAARCMAELLVARPGFNYSSDLLQALVPMMLGPDAQVQQVACSAVRQLLQDDVQGNTSLEAVQLVADLVRKKKCAAPPVVVSTLLVLRFEQVTPVSAGGEGAGAGKAKKLGKKAARRAKRKSELDKDFEEAEAGPDLKQLAILQSQMLEALFEVFFRVLKHCSTAAAQQAAAAAAAANGPAAAAAAKGPAAAAAAVSDTKGVLLQPWPAAKVARKFPLLQPVLEGLGRYSHLISVEYFNDLMAVLQELLGTGALPLRERLAVLLAALDILKGQGEALTIDRRAFYNHLYQTMLLVPLQVLYDSSSDSAAATSGHQAAAATSRGAVTSPEAAAEQDEDITDAEDQQALQAVRASLYGLESITAQQQQQGSSTSSSNRDVAPTAVLLLRCLEQQLLGVKQTDMGRLAAFTKRLAQLMLSASPSEAVGCACLMYRLVRRYHKLVCQFEWEGGAPVGGRQFDPDCPDPSEAGALAAALWELPLLSQHYHPHVAAAAKALLGLTPGAGAAAAGAANGDAPAAGAGSGGAGAVITGAAGPQELAAVYGVVYRGGFRPAPVAPAGLGRGRSGSGSGITGSSKAGMAARQIAAASPWCWDLQEAAAAAQQQQQHLKQQKKRKQQEFVQAMQSAGDVNMEAVQQAVHEQYQVSKRYRRNRELRVELAVLAKKLELFREHLIEKRQQQLQQKQQVTQKQKTKKQQHNGSK